MKNRSVVQIGYTLFILAVIVVGCLVVRGMFVNDGKMARAARDEARRLDGTVWTVNEIQTRTTRGGAPRGVQVMAESSEGSISFPAPEGQIPYRKGKTFRWQLKNDPPEGSWRFADYLVAVPVDPNSPPEQ